MSKIICVVFISMLVNFGYSQKWYLGLNTVGDFNLYKFYNSDYIVGRTLVKTDVGLTFGFSGLYVANKNVTIQGGLAITTKQLVPDINKVDYIFESVHYTSLEFPLRVKYILYFFNKKETEDKKIKSRSKNKNKVKTEISQSKSNDLQLSIIGGLSYSHMLKVSPQYFDDGNVMYLPLDLESLLYPEFGIGFSKHHKDAHLFAIDFVTRISRKPYEFSTSVVEKLSVEFSYFYKM